MRYTPSGDIDKAIRAYKKGHGNIVLSEVRNGTGFDRKPRTADMLSISTWPSRGLYIEGFEIKVTRPDLTRELARPEKSDEIARYCKYWWLAVPDDLLTDELRAGVPERWGVLEVSEKGRVKVSKPADQLDSIPMDTLMCCAVPRNFAESHTCNCDIAAKIQGAVDAGVKSALDSRISRIRDLETAIAKFKEHSGIDLLTDYKTVRFDIEGIGEAVRLVHAMKRHPRRELMSARESLMGVANAIEQIASVVCPEVSE